MDVVFFFLGIIVIVTACTFVAWDSIHLHHRRELEKLRQRELSDQRKFTLMHEALEQGRLPPGQIKFD